MKIINKIIDTLKSRWLMDTGKTVIFIAIIILLFLGVNIVIKVVDPKDIDLTPEKLYTLTDESKEKIASIPESDRIEIYIFDFNEKDVLPELAKQYTKINRNITLEVIENPEKRPDLTSKYNIESGYGTILIVSGEKHKTYTSYDFFTKDYSTGKQIDISEQRFTNAIIALSSIGKTTPIYMLTGHEEKNPTNNMTYFKIFAELENYEVRTLDLLSSQNVPEDCSALIIASPTIDFKEPEVKAIKEYIKKGGNILWFSNSYSASGETPNVQSILDMYGVNIRQDGIIYEQNKSNTIGGIPYFIKPEIEYTDLTSKLSSALLLDSGKLEFAEDLESLGVIKTDLLKTSEKAFFRTNIELTSITPQNEEKEEICVTAAILEREDENTKSKLVVFANNLFAEDTPINVDGANIPAIGFYGNKDLAINAVRYVAEIEDEMIIRKEIKIIPYTATAQQDRVVKTIIFGLPVIIILIGLVIWQLRRIKV